MREVVGRRFDHAKREPEGNFGRLPNLVVIDGGPEQLKNAHEAMIDAGFGHIPVISPGQEVRGDLPARPARSYPPEA